MGSLGFLVVTAVVLAPGGAWAAYQGGFLTVLGTSVSEPACGAQPLQSVSAGDPGRLLRLEVNTHDSPEVATLCVYNERLVKIYERTELVGPGRDLTVDVLVPKGSYGVRVEMAGQQTATDLHPDFCADHAARFTTSGGRASARCIVWPGEPLVDEGSHIAPQSIPAPPKEKVLHVATSIWYGLGGIVGLLWVARWETIRLPLFATFARVTGPAILDHRKRQQIQQLVAANPGIHASEILGALDLSTGQGAHHLRAMVRENVLDEMRTIGFVYYFPPGRYSTQQKQALSVARNASARRLLQAVANTPGATLATISAAARLSVARASKLAKRLDAVGVIAKQPRGKAIALLPRYDSIVWQAGIGVVTQPVLPTARGVR